MSDELKPIIRPKRETISIEFDVEYDEVYWDGGWIPKTVYKYRDWENRKHRKILKDKTIWVPDSFNFNDPFDCSIPIAYNLLLEDDILAEEFFRYLLINNNFAGDIESQVKLMMQENKHKDPDFIGSYKDELLESVKRVNGVFSVTPVKDNILMWSHYANSHKGFCIGFDSIKLFNCLSGGGGYVNYAKDYPIIPPLSEIEETFKSQILTKSIHWAYEKEYRLTTFPITNIKITIPPDVITEVIFGANISLENKTKIKETLKRNLSHIKCFSAVVDKDSFKLNIVPENTTI